MKTSTKDEITEEIRSSVDDHNCSAQRYRQLKSALSKCDSKFVGDTLLGYWGTLKRPDSHFAAQQFVASLLFALNPETSFSLTDLLRILSSWNLSVEEFPWYLAMRFGKAQVLQELHSLENKLSGDMVFTRAAETVRYWLQADYVSAWAHYSK